MTSICSFNNTTVPGIINGVREKIEEYKTNKNPDLLKEVIEYLQQAQRMLWHSIKFTKDQDTKRLKAIKRQQEEIDELKRGINGL